MKKTITLLSTLFITIIVHAQIPNHVPTNGLIGYWPFTGNANDESGNGNNGTVQGATLSTDRFNSPNNAYDFSGDDTILVINPNALPTGNSAFTISAWINSNTWMYRGTILGWGIGSSAGSEASYVRTDENGGMLHYFWLNDLYAATADLSNAWHHVAVAYDGNARTMFIDGAPVSNDVAAPVNMAYTNLSIGVQQADPAGICGSCGFDGKIDDLGLWNRALTQQEITDLYNGTGSNPCTVYDTVTVYDTTFVTVFDTTHVTVYDTTKVSVSTTDTLIIDFATGISAPNNTNTVKVYPNPAKDYLIIDNGNLAAMTGYSIKVTNSLGQVVFNQPVTQQQFNIDLSTWSGSGSYLLTIINAQQQIIETKTVVLQ